MTIQHHPLSNARLGDFIRAETEVIKNGLSPAIFNTRFQYQYGSVTLDSKWQYQTRFNDGDCVIVEQEQNRKEVQLDQQSIAGMDDMSDCMSLGILLLKKIEEEQNTVMSEADEILPFPISLLKEIDKASYGQYLVAAKNLEPNPDAFNAEYQNKNGE